MCGTSNPPATMSRRSPPPQPRAAIVGREAPCEARPRAPERRLSCQGGSRGSPSLPPPPPPPAPGWGGRLPLPTNFCGVDRFRLVRLLASRSMNAGRSDEGCSSESGTISSSRISSPGKTRGTRLSRRLPDGTGRAGRDTLRPSRRLPGTPLLPSASGDGPTDGRTGSRDRLLPAQRLPRGCLGCGGAPAAGPPPVFIELRPLLPRWGRGAGFNGSKCPGLVLPALDPGREGPAPRRCRRSRAPPVAASVEPRPHRQLRRDRDGLRLWVGAGSECGLRGGAGQRVRAPRCPFRTPTRGGNPPRRGAGAGLRLTANAPGSSHTAHTGQGGVLVQGRP